MRNAHVLQRSVMIDCVCEQSNCRAIRGRESRACGVVIGSPNFLRTAEARRASAAAPASIHYIDHTHTTMSTTARPLAALKSALRQLRADKHHSRYYATAAPATTGRPVNFHPGAIMTGRSTTHHLLGPRSSALTCFQTANTA